MELPVSPFSWNDEFKSVPTIAYARGGQVAAMQGGHCRSRGFPIDRDLNFGALGRVSGIPHPSAHNALLCALNATTNNTALHLNHLFLCRILHFTTPLPRRGSARH